MLKNRDFHFHVFHAVFMARSVFSWPFHAFSRRKDFRGFMIFVIFVVFVVFMIFVGFFRDFHVFAIFMFCARCEYEKGLETHHSHEARTGEFLLLARPHRAASVC